MIGETIPVLDKGFVRFVDIMGGDDAVVQAARCSYGEGTTTKRRDEQLIRYLWEHEHTSPFEMVEYKFHLKLPLYIGEQFLRHRTANVNKYSLRYSEPINEIYMPEIERMRKQDGKNRQGSSDPLDRRDAESAVKIMHEHCTLALNTYNKLTGMGLAREIARSVLPTSIYTTMYWKIDLRNLLHFLKIRLDLHAQWEMQQYARAISKIVNETCPITYKAFTDFTLKGR